jgi:glycine oxidase
MGATAADVVVVGAGVIGLSVAWEAAAAGMSVSVVDPRPGRGATWAAAGMLAPVGEANFGEEALTVLNIEAARAWPRFAEALEVAAGRSVGYVAGGTLLVAADTSDRAVTDDLLGYRAQLGLTAQRLSSGECRALEPLLAPGIRGGAHLVGDHQVDNRRLVDALIAACRAVRVELIEDEVSAVEVGAGRALGVSLRHGGRRPAGTVVLAAGCHSGRIGGIPVSVLPPVRPVKGLTLRLRAPDDTPVLRRTVRGLVYGRSCYLVPRADRTVVVGATVEERGFDLAVRAGAVGDLLDDARRLVPSFEEYELADTTTGLRPGSPDNAPIVGRTGLPGLLVATGHYRNGILLAPITAAEVVRLLRSGGGLSPDGPFADFGPDRFTPVAGPAAATMSSVEP